jgi:hypothetical protein
MNLDSFGLLEADEVIETKSGQAQDSPRQRTLELRVFKHKTQSPQAGQLWSERNDSTTIDQKN